MTSTVSSKNKEKGPKGKIVFKKETKQEKTTVQKTENGVAGNSNPATP